MISEDRVRLVAKNSNFGLLSQSYSSWSEHTFDIVVYGDNDADIVAGQMCVYKLNVGDVLRQKIPMELAFDSFLQETYDCYNVVFTQKGSLRKPFWDEYYDQMEDLFNDFHLLSRIEIDERFKGNGLAGIVTQIYLENFANGSDVAYFKAFPLQHEGKEGMCRRTFAGDFKLCEKKLCAYYQRLGFRRIGKTPHFFFVVDDFLDKRKDMQ